MVFIRFNDFFNCSSILNLGIRIADWGGSLSRSGLFNIYIEVIKNCGCFSRVVFKDSIFFKSDAIISYDSSISEKGVDCIPKRLTTFFTVTFRKYAFLAYWVLLLHLFLIFIGQEPFIKRSLEGFRFRSLHNLFI